MSSVNTESGKPGCHKDTDNNTQHHNHENGSGPHDHVDSAAHQELIIEGAGCASCVGKIESALKAVPGVENAEMNFAQRTVSVIGNAAASDLLKAVEKAGYNAKLAAAENEDDALAEKEKADQVYYKRLMKETWIALSLGGPLMAYALITGEVNVNTTTERIAWLVVGILTFGVLYFSGKHFFVGAWKSFLNHSANMDTLIALGTGTAWLYSMVVVFFPTPFPIRRAMSTSRLRRSLSA